MSFLKKVGDAYSARKAAKKIQDGLVNLFFDDNNNDFSMKLNGDLSKYEIEINENICIDSNSKKILEKAIPKALLKGIELVRKKSEDMMKNSKMDFTQKDKMALQRQMIEMQNTMKNTFIAVNTEEGMIRVEVNSDVSKCFITFKNFIKEDMREDIANKMSKMIVDLARKSQEAGARMIQEAGIDFDALMNMDEK